MNAVDLAYDVAVGMARTAAPLAGVSSKLGRALHGRARAGDRLAEWARTRTDGGDLVWFHAPSVGEGLQARAVLRELRALVPDLLTVFTHTSPSAERLAETLDVEAAGYLPWDAGQRFETLFGALRPSLIVFTQKEVWPGVARSAHERGVPVALIAATLPRSAGRLRRPGRWLLRPTFARLAAVLAIAPDDARRFRDLAVPDDRVTVTGDPGVDSAWERASATDPAAPHLAPFHEAPAPTIVAGSTWPADEAALFPAAVRVRDAVPGLRLIVVPHEPTEERVVRLLGDLERDGWRCERLSAVLKRRALEAATAIVVDSVGFLADLYSVGSVVLVGGAYDPTGLHSVLEPAAAGCPVCFGPLYAESRAASDLLASGAARVATSDTPLAEVLLDWLTDPSALRAAGAAARSYISRHRGSARRSAEMLERLIDGGPSDA